MGLLELNMFLKKERILGVRHLAISLKILGAKIELRGLVKVF